MLSFGQVLMFSLAVHRLLGAHRRRASSRSPRRSQPLVGADFPYVAAAYPVAFCVAVLTFIVPSGLGTRDAALAVAMSAVLPGPSRPRSRSGSGSSRR